MASRGLGLGLLGVYCILGLLGGLVVGVVQFQARFPPTLFAASIGLKGLFIPTCLAIHFRKILPNRPIVFIQ